MAVPVFARKNGGRYKHTSSLQVSNLPGWFHCAHLSTYLTNKAPRHAIETREGRDAMPIALPSLDPEARGQERGIRKHACNLFDSCRTAMATTSSSSRDGVHDVPDQAYQPSNFSFPRREFG